MESSFCDRVKEQLIDAVPKNRCCRTSMLTGIMLCEKKRKNPLSPRIEELCVHLKRPQSRRKKEGELFGELSAPTGYTAAEGSKTLNCDGTFCRECAASLVRGCFISGGRSGDPFGSMYLELSMPGEELCTQVFELLSERGLSPKRTVRRGESIIYFKKTESIEDALNFMGAIQASFELINAKIENGYRRRANRARNCDTSNINKAVDAAAKQNAAIKAIRNAGLMDALPTPLRQTALLRESHPFEPIEGLTALHSEPITKSGVYHRLSKIVKFADANRLFEKVSE